VRLEITQISGPVPVKRRGTIDLATLPAPDRKGVEAALRSALEQPSPRTAGRTPPDVGSSSITIFADDGSETRLSFSEAEATAEQTALLRAVRPFLKIERWGA